MLLLIISSLLISVNGFMLRSIDSANEWQVIFCRQVFFTSAILLLLALQYPGSVTAIISTCWLAWYRRWHRTGSCQPDDHIGHDTHDSGKRTVHLKRQPLDHRRAGKDFP